MAGNCLLLLIDDIATLLDNIAMMSKMAGKNGYQSIARGIKPSRGALHKASFFKVGLSLKSLSKKKIPAILINKSFYLSNRSILYMATVDRQYIRHPSEIPLEYALTETPPDYHMDYISNVSEGGLSFHSDHYIAPQKWIHLYIPIDENYFEADAQVRWCKETGYAAESSSSTHQATTNHSHCHSSHHNQYNIGVSFRDKEQAFSARMVEQICYIEEYKRTVKQKEGRELTSDQAAAEWIEKYASDFPQTINKNSLNHGG